MSPRRLAVARLKLKERAAASVKAKAVEARRRKDAIGLIPLAVQQAVVHGEPRAPLQHFYKASHRPPPLSSSYARPPPRLSLRGRGAESSAKPAGPSQTPKLNTVEPYAVRVAQHAAHLTKPAEQKAAIRRTSRPRVRGLSPPNTTHAGISKLRTVLGLDGSSSDSVGGENAVLVSIDTESERGGLIDHVVEVGITTLAVRDLEGIEPGEWLTNWTARMKHEHIVVDVTRRPRARMDSSLFGRSQFLSAAEARTALLSTLQTCITSRFAPGDNQGPPTLHLVGQSIDGDISVLRRSGVRLDLLDPAQAGITFTNTFDTAHLASKAISSGAKIPRIKLAHLAFWLGVHPEYWAGNADVRGVHNASNDAAYTMMVLLLMALKWDELVKGTDLAPSADEATTIYKSFAEKRKLQTETGREDLRVTKKPALLRLGPLTMWKAKKPARKWARRQRRRIRNIVEGVLVLCACGLLLGEGFRVANWCLSALKGEGDDEDEREE